MFFYLVPVERRFLRFLFPSDSSISDTEGTNMDLNTRSGVRGPLSWTRSLLQYVYTHRPLDRRLYPCVCRHTRLRRRLCLYVCRHTPLGRRLYPYVHHRGLTQADQTNSGFTKTTVSTLRTKIPERRWGKKRHEFFPPEEELRVLCGYVEGVVHSPDINIGRLERDNLSKVLSLL